MLICDEVIGFRLAYAGAHTIFGLEPDLIALGKIIGGGLPVGAVAGPADRMAVFDHTRGTPAVSHGGTFSANPLTMVAGRVTLEAFGKAAVERLTASATRCARASRPASTPPHRRADDRLGSLFRLHLTKAPITDYRSSYPMLSQRRRSRPSISPCSTAASC